MADTVLLSLTLILGLVILFFITRTSLNTLFGFLTLFLPKSFAFGLIALLFFPGTVVHELAHFFVAIALFLKVRELHLFPEWSGDYIKFGHVAYEKADFVRGIIVGIAPLPVGLLCFWAMYRWNVFPSASIGLSIFWGYIIFALSSSMFSSKQDLIELAYLTPVLLLVAFLAFLFPEIASGIFGNAASFGGKALMQAKGFMEAANRYVYMSLAIHVGIILVLKLVRRIFNT